MPLPNNLQAFAFPQDDAWSYAGLTKREYFAAMIMQSVLAKPGAMITKKDEVALQAVTYADALIQALNDS